MADAAAERSAPHTLGDNCGQSEGRNIDAADRFAFGKPSRTG
jgi:hypothetical protein